MLKADTILDHTREQGRVTMREMVRATGASGNTLKEHFRRLVQKKLLLRHGAGRATWYELP